MAQATRSQLFALYADTGRCMELRNLGPKLTLETAKGMLSRMRDQGVSPEVIRQELLDLGATAKGEGTPVEAKPRVDFQAIYNEAHAAGMAAADQHTPTPMVVQQHANPLNDRSPVTQQWTVAGGCCGFAWISFAGNTAWGRWTSKQGLSSKDYPTGLCIWVSEFGQSMELKEKYAGAFAGVLQKHGIKAYMRSRMD